MQIPQGATVAVADGKTLHLFHNKGDEAHPVLVPMPADVLDRDGGGSTGHHSSSANPDESQKAEDGFAAGVAGLLNRQVLAGSIKHLIVIAAPRTLGELRHHYHKTLSAILVGEIAKDLTGHSQEDVERAIAAA